MREYIVRETGYPGTLKTEIVCELVRCRDCKWWNKDAYSRDDTRFCYEHAHYLPQDYFCATGERRDDD